MAFLGKNSTGATNCYLFFHLKFNQISYKGCGEISPRLAWCNGVVRVAWLVIAARINVTYDLN